MYDVDPVARLPAPHQCEKLVGGQVERVKREAEGLVLDEREESIRAVLRPLDEDGLVGVVNLGFDEGGQFANRLDPR